MNDPVPAREIAQTSDPDERHLNGQFRLGSGSIRYLVNIQSRHLKGRRHPDPLLPTAAGPIFLANFQRQLVRRRNSVDRLPQNVDYSGANMARLIDISPPMKPGMAVYPGDTPYSVNSTLEIGDSCLVNVSAISMTSHCGAHADAPYHYDQDGASIDEIPLATFVGPVRVIDARGADPLCVPADIAAQLADTPPRVLLRLEDHLEPLAWPAGHRALSPEVIHMLASLGVILVGVDVPSVDSEIAKELPTHFACRDCGLVILENLDLSGVDPGDYELIALPLRLEGLDASPVRAVLRSSD